MRFILAIILSLVKTLAESLALENVQALSLILDLAHKIISEYLGSVIWSIPNPYLRLFFVFTSIGNLQKQSYFFVSPCKVYFSVSLESFFLENLQLFFSAPSSWRGLICACSRGKSLKKKLRALSTISTNRSRVNKRYFRAKKETVLWKQYVPRNFSTGEIFDRYRVNITLVRQEIDIEKIIEP